VHSSRMSADVRAHLAQQIHRVDWKPLAPHAKRGGLVMVAPELDLLEVGVAVAEDNGAQVQRWMEAQQLRRATEAQTQTWGEGAEERFTVLIVQPYVLVQRDPDSAVAP